MDSSHFADAVRRTVSPAMAIRGFGPPGPGLSPDGSVAFLYCTGAQAFASRWSEAVDLLCAKTQVDLEDPSRCLDLVVEATPDGEIVRVDLEFVGLDALLDAAHLDDLAHRCSVEALRGTSATESATRIRDAVDALMPLGPEAPPLGRRPSCP